MQQKLLDLNRQLMTAMRNDLRQHQHRLSLQARSLDNLSPLKTLARGYVVISKQQQLVTSVSQLQTDDEIGIELKDGKSRARII